MSAETRSGDPDQVRANKLDLLERIADDLAHEIKNPLHSMVINLEVLKRRVVRSDASEPEELLKYVGVLDGELDRVNRRVELLLRIMRPGRGREPVPLPEVVLEVLELVELDCRRRRIELDYRPHALASRVRLPLGLGSQMLLNLVLGAIDSIPAGGALRVSVEPSDGEVELVVRGEVAGEGDELPLVPEAEERLALLDALGETLGARVRLLGPPSGDGATPGPLAFALTFPVQHG